MLKGLRTGKTFVFLVIALGAVLLLAGCGGKKEETKSQAPGQPQQAGQPAPQKAITIAIPAEPTMLDPQKENDGNMRAVTVNVFESLLVLNGKTLKPEPWLATAFKLVDDTHWQFTIKDGVKFQNGDLMTVDDVVFSINRLIDPKFQSNILSYFSTIEKAEKVNDKTVTVITKGPDPLLPTRMTIMPIMSQKFVQSVGDQVIAQTNGTGPYKVTEWKRGVSLSMEANPNYWGTKPDIQKVSYRFVEESATRASGVKTGEFDLAVNMLPEYVKDLPGAKEVAGLEFAIVRFNMLRGAFTNKDLRQAAAYAVDLKAIAESLYQGHATIAPGQPSKPSFFGFNPNLKAYTYDLEKAKELVKQSGYKGEPIQFIMEGGRWLKDRELSETVAAMMQQAGLNIQAKMVSWQEWLDIYFNKDKAPDMMLTFGSNDVFDVDRTLSNWIHSQGRGSNHPNAFDAKIEEARKELDLQKRQKSYEEINQGIYDEVAYLPLINTNDIYGMSKKLDWQPREDGKLTVFEMKLIQ